MNDIPSVLYRTKPVTLGNGETVQIKGHRGNDFSLLRKISKVEAKSMKLTIKLAKLTTTKNNDGVTVNKPDADLTEKDINALMDMREKIDDLQDETRPVIMQLAQRGLKRFYYPDKKTSELDELPNIELNWGEALEIHQAMNILDRPLVVDDTKNDPPEKS